MSKNVKEFSKVLLKNANLLEFSQAIMRGNGIDNDNVLIRTYFDNKEYYILAEELSMYLHNICQYVMDDFFESKLKFKKTKETNCEDSVETPVVYENLEINKKDYKRVFKNAYVMYERKNGTTVEKICVFINKYNSNDISYKIYSSSKELISLMSEWFLYARKHNVYRNKKIDANCNFLTVSDVKFDDIILPKDIIEIVRSQISDLFLYSEYLKANNITLKRGIILSGSPGTGKTMLCKALISESKHTVIYALPSHCRESKDISRLCEMAKELSPCLLIIEDIDHLAENREESYAAGSVIELMNQLDGVQEFSDIITLATTNNKDKIEDAVSNRPGRFDRIIDVPKPDEKHRMLMIKSFTEKAKFEGKIDWDGIVGSMDGFSGSHIKDIYKTAVFHAIKDKSVDENKIVIIKQSHFNSALKEVGNEKYSSFNKASKKKIKLGF